MGSPQELLLRQAWLCACLVQMAVRYARQLTEAHDSACPWATNCCAASLLQFPPLTQARAAGGRAGGRAQQRTGRRWPAA